jgi:hypothetical protein
MPLVRYLWEPVMSASSRVLHLLFMTMWTKGANSVLCCQNYACDPIVALLFHLKTAECTLFSYIPPQGVVCLTKKRFLARCNKILNDCSLSTISSQLFHIRGTRELLICGVSPDVVPIMGQWSSDLFLRYWRSLELIMPHHAEFLPDMGREV